jgi:hypothetical protein
LSFLTAHGVLRCTTVSRAVAMACTREDLWRSLVILDGRDEYDTGKLQLIATNYHGRHFMDLYRRRKAMRNRYPYGTVYHGAITVHFNFMCPLMWSDLKEIPGEDPKRVRDCSACHNRIQNLTASDAYGGKGCRAVSGVQYFYNEEGEVTASVEFEEMGEEHDMREAPAGKLGSAAPLLQIQRTVEQGITKSSLFSDIQKPILSHESTTKYRNHVRRVFANTPHCQTSRREKAQAGNLTNTPRDEFRLGKFRPPPPLPSVPAESVGEDTPCARRRQPQGT